MAKTASTMVPLGTIAPAFALPDTTANNTVVQLSDFVGRPLLVLFICNHCPFVRHVAAQLAALARDLPAQGVAVVAISSNDAEAYPADAPAAMTLEARAQGWRFPYLYDQTQAIAQAYRAACTPDVYLFDAAHRLVYRGQLDDSRPGSTLAVTGADLRAAVTALLAKQPQNLVQKPSIGCNIKWRPGHAPDYFPPLI